MISLRWRHNGHNSISNHQPHDCLLNRLSRRRSKKTSKVRVTGLCAGNSPGTGEFPAQMASNAENVSIWWRRHIDWVTVISISTCDGLACVVIKPWLLSSPHKGPVTRKMLSFDDVSMIFSYRWNSVIGIRGDSCGNSTRTTSQCGETHLGTIKRQRPIFAAICLRNLQHHACEDFLYWYRCIRLTEQ